MSKKDYDTGYGKPPKHSQFSKGQSGNPKGRPKGRKNIATLLHDVLYEKVSINENGVRKKITKLEASLKQVVNKSAAGDNSSMKILVPLLHLLDPLSDNQNTSLSQEAELEIIHQLKLRARGLKIKHKTVNEEGETS